MIDHSEEVLRMKANSKKAIALILSIMLFLTSIAFTPFLSSCMSEEPDKGKKDTDDSNATSDGTGTETAEVLEIPKEDFGGASFVILTADPVRYNWSVADFDEPSDEPYEQAMYERNLAVEELLNIDISSVTATRGGATYDLFRTSTMASSGDYSCAFLTTPYSATATGAGLTLSWDNLDYVDLTKSWWNKASIDQLSLGGKTYMVAGEAMLSDKECLWLVYFLKDKIKDKNLEDPYELVDNNEWTWDKMMEMATIAKDELNGDGVMDKSDSWGLVTHMQNYAALWMAAGEKLVTIDETGTPQLTWGTERFVEVFDKIIEIMANTEVVYCEDAFIITTMREGRTLFATEVVAYIKYYRDNEYDFGLLPMPKYEKSQPEYYTYAAIDSDLCVVGIDCGDTYYTSIVLEALASYGKKILLPAYYDQQLSSHFARDENCARMLDIVFKNRMYDLGVAFDWGGAWSALSKTTANAATLYASLNKSMRKSMEKTLEKAGVYD